MRGLLRSKFPILLAAFVIAAVVALPMAIAVGSVQVTRAGALSFLSVGSLDCNGYSNIQKPLRPHDICTDLRGFNGERGEDNDHYIAQYPV